MKFYHASPVRFHVGDVITGGHEGGYGSRHPAVCMSTSPVPHGTIQSQVTEDWFVYEVVPMFPATFNDGNKEYQTRAAKVVKLLGKAKPLLKNEPEETTSWVGFRSMALPPEKERRKIEDQQKQREKDIERSERPSAMRARKDPSARRVASRYSESTGS